MRFFWDPQAGDIFLVNPCHSPCPSVNPLFVSLYFFYLSSSFPLLLLNISSFWHGHLTSFGLIKFWGVFRTFLSLIYFIHRDLVSFVLRV